jgi:hypothetical protein
VSADLLERIREASARVMERARQVRIDEPRLAALAGELLDASSRPSLLDPAHNPFDDAEATLAYVVTLDAINFGSGWFPHLSKRPGLSGYLTLSTALAERFEREGPWSADELSRLSARECAASLGQDLAKPEVAELMELYSRALRELGDFLVDRYAGAFDGPIREASGKASKLVEILGSMPLYRDEFRYAGRTIPFYKRAQITASDLARAFGEKGLGEFSDLDDLTLFADNLVPHVLRCAGVLVYDAALAQRIEAAENIEAGSPPEIEMRALAVHAVEGLVRRVREFGTATAARELDTLLWTRGQHPEIKASPRHRTRSTFY